MGIVSNMSTRDTRHLSEDVDGADDPLPSIDGQLGINADPDREKHGGRASEQGKYLKVHPLTGVILALALLVGGAAVAVLLAPDLGPRPDSRTGPATGATTSEPSQIQPDPNAGPGTDPGAPDSGGGAGAPGLATLNAPEQGYSLDYPSAWQFVTDQSVDPATPQADQATVLRIAGQNAFSIRTFDLAEPVAEPDLADMRAVTDAILSTPGAKLTVLDVRATKVGGLPAVYYLYYFPSGKQQGLHAHYFVFDGTRMHSMVFQVVPATKFPQYAADFDSVVASFRPVR